jgi:hypothetical protein
MSHTSLQDVLKDLPPQLHQSAIRLYEGNEETEITRLFHLALFREDRAAIIEVLQLHHALSEIDEIRNNSSCDPQAHEDTIKAIPAKSIEAPWIFNILWNNNPFPNTKPIGYLWIIQYLKLQCQSHHTTTVINLASYDAIKQTSRDITNQTWNCISQVHLPNSKLPETLLDNLTFAAKMEGWNFQIVSMIFAHSSFDREHFTNLLR